MPANNQGASLALEISNRVVGLVAEYTGRGPTKARTTINDDLVVVLPRDTLTKSERHLVASGQRDTVLQLRSAFQLAMQEEASTAISELTGRDVIGFMSANHIDPDLAIEAFVLAPTITS
jgi:uncharacterized protein YbcI